MKKLLLTALFSSLFIPHIYATLTIGDSSAPTNETFSFEVGHAKFNQSSGDRRLWYASGEDLSASSDDVKKYGLGYIQELKAEPVINSTTLKLIQPAARPLANSEDATIYSATISGGKATAIQSTTATNPIYGASFSFFGVVNSKPAFTVATEPTKVYYAQDIKHFDTQTDENKNTTELLIHDLGTDNNVRALTETPSSIAVAFTENGSWGTAPSKIIRLLPASFEIQAADKDKKIAAKTAPYLLPSSTFEVSTSTSQLLGGGADLLSLGTDVTLKNKGESIYVGLNVIAAAGNQAAAMLVVTGTSTLGATTITSNDIVASGTDTVVSVGASKGLRIHNTAFMKTSTGLEYMIVSRQQGSLGDFSLVNQNIYAVPLVSTGAHAGRIADFTSITNSFNSLSSMFSARHFNTLLSGASNASQIEPGGTYDEQLKVGQAAAPVVAGKVIKDMYVIGDTVYVVIDQEYATGTEPGTFCSQAIFAADGHIINWTPWTRVLGTDNATSFSYVSRNTTAGFYITKGATSGKFSSVYQTQWHSDNNLKEFTSRSHFFPAGTQGLFNFPQSTSGFNNAMSLLVATGYNSIVLGQTGTSNGFGGVQATTISSAEIVQPDSDNLDHGALVAAELAHNGSDHWLFVGGASGLSVLTDGTGVTKTGNFTDVTDFNAGQTWKKVGDFSLVKKLAWDNTYLYILTNTAVYRIELNASFKSDPENPTITTILTPSQLNNVDYFLDLIIDDNFCILGTTNGLYSFDSSSGAASNITKVTIPSGLPAVTQLFVVSTGNDPQRTFKDTSNLYVLNSKFGTQQAHLNRFVINNSTITSFQDQLLQNNNTSFMKFNNYTTSYFTNGSWNLASQYFLGTTQPESVDSPSVLQIFTGVQNGFSSTHKTMTFMYSALVPTSFISDTDNILNIVRDSTSGALIMTGNFHARVNA